MRGCIDPSRRERSRGPGSTDQTYRLDRDRSPINGVVLKKWIPTRSSSQTFGGTRGPSTALISKVIQGFAGGDRLQPDVVFRTKSKVSPRYLTGRMRLRGGDRAGSQPGQGTPRSRSRSIHKYSPGIERQADFWPGASNVRRQVNGAGRSSAIKLAPSRPWNLGCR